ncbi:DNA polymerase III subunit gamma/tau [Bordetella genomosp. 5]|uniref:DNA polymerase III subunit gamma/tau n=1 Tax=Bordetella genomosp. 5 TaxID=1395608 RepID=UPI000B9E6DF0|nr:DNA polymerase III subunit gamma/tau [Bordetella genomosp. 5]OZI40015.1 DNA polymerase III subunit gamma/tau [Bordetella genomosp. 5]
MTYLVLARKWRPRSFDTLVGQDHVVRALTHALDTQRLHHAWLFTGTRGVGKTTLSRILAKSLNCETGITSKPCGVCRACTEIDAGRFVDYLELDAASNRGVEEMTQLLEQAVYSPGAGRFKVYMIDEVHMLTGHAFNAMLKTLEEPPPHVKFILATTDPQKIPVTVLSRCLQFNLKQMPSDSIVGHLQAVLGQEQVAFDVPALRLIGQAAGGSMRDALSLTDQAIAYSAGNLTEDAVRGMLGTIDQRHLVRLLDALAANDAAGVLAVADELSTRGLSYAGALADLAVLLSRVAIEQRVTGVTAADDPLAADIARLALALHPDAVQLFYSVAVHSRGELTLAPDEYAGFIMACLRMLALHGDAGPATQAESPARVAPVPRAEPVAAAAPAAVAAPVTPAQPAAQPAPSAVEARAPEAAPSPAADTPAAAAATPAAGTPAAGTPAADAPSQSAALARNPVAAVVSAPASPPAPPAPPAVSAGPAGVPPWEDNPAATSDAAASGSVASGAAAPGAAAPEQAAPMPAAPQSTAVADARQAVATRDVATSAAPADDDGPPSWVDEAIPDEAEGGYAAEAFTQDPDDDFETLAPAASAERAPPPSRGPAAPAPRRARGGSRSRVTDMSSEAWPDLAAKLPVTGLAAELARQSEWAGVQGDAVLLRVAVRTLAESESRVRLQTVLCEHFGQGLRLEIEVGATGDATAHAVAQIERAARQQAAEDAVQVDPFVQALVADFGGQVVPGSVRHVDNPPAA